VEADLCFLSVLPSSPLQPGDALSGHGCCAAPMTATPTPRSGRFPVPLAIQVPHHRRSMLTPTPPIHCCCHPPSRDRSHGTMAGEASRCGGAWLSSGTRCRRGTTRLQSWPSAAGLVQRHPALVASRGGRLQARREPSCLRPHPRGAAGRRNDGNLWARRYPWLAADLSPSMAGVAGPSNGRLLLLLRVVRQGARTPPPSAASSVARCRRCPFAGGWRI
jgi:hypothetical protein